MQISEWEIPLLLIFIIVAATGGFAAGIGITDDVWTNDCQKMGAHRINNIVYQCKEQKQ